jgi:hypothetical protein
VDRVGAAAELLGDQRPLQPRPALAAVVARVEPAGQARRQRLPLDPLDRLLGQLAVGHLGLDLERDQHLVGEAPGAFLEVQGGVVEALRRH